MITKEQVQSDESAYFIDRTFDGSLPGFMAAFFGGKRISHEEAEKLKRLIDEYKEEARPC